MPALIRILSETTGATPEGDVVVYRLAKEPGRGYVVIRHVRRSGRPDMQETPGLSLKAALECLRRLKAHDRGEHHVPSVRP